MRPGQQNSNNSNKNRSRGRNNNGGRKHVNPLSRNFESNGPDVKVRGNAAHIAEKYVQLARDAHASGDSVMAENYFQHAEHYFRIVSAAQPQGVPRTDQFGQDSDGDEDDNSDAGGYDAGGYNGNDGYDTRRGNDDRSRNDDRPRQEQRGQGSQQGESQPRQAPPAEAAPVVSQTGPDAAPAEANGNEAGTDDEAAAPRKVRERRPRRRRVAASEGAGGSDGAGPQPEVGDLPAFITAGGPPNAAE